jgi:uncharacterized protein YjbI with pentapeptide repeats
VLLRDRSAGGNNLAAESLRNAGIAVVGGVTVGTIISLVQRAINADLADRAAAADRQRSLDLVVATRQDLKTIDLSRADLRGRYLAGKDLTRAELGDADLRSANLRHAVLCEAQLVGADLTGADLTGADLTGADLTGADLMAVDFTGARLADVVADATTRWPASHPGGVASGTT